MRTTVLTPILALMLAVQLSASAEGVDLAVKNAAIEKLNTRMAERAAKVTAWKDKGAIGEENTGLLHDRQSAGLSLAEKKEVRDLIVAENEDRYALFREIRIANNIAEADLAKVCAAYAKSRRDAATPEHWLQHPSDGKWLQKKDLKE
jgi:uncharacterized protein